MVNLLKNGIYMEALAKVKNVPSPLAGEGAGFQDFCKMLYIFAFAL